FRCDANVSIRPVGETELGVKTELKNMNSFRGVERALEYEIKRQTNLLNDGGEIVQQTLLWDADRNEAIPMRSKEYADDYRYFPEPDLVPVQISQAWSKEIRYGLPELPTARKRRFVKEYGLPEYDAEILTETRRLADYFEEVANLSGDAKASSNWIMGEVLRTLKEKQIPLSEIDVQPADLADLVKLVNSGSISGNIGKSVFQKMIDTGKDAETIVQKEGLLQVSDTQELQRHVVSAIKANPDEVQKFLDGKEQILGFLVGQVMKATQGKANPKVVNELLRAELAKIRVKG
ncbi:Asp-tRNA(Asn)/Glu-tRNA(Gln) amidotransferase subunit GatB, partial [bacterium]|nr:Asp-tRNA(Asn)/Glu-tRNA(Gln) amidotransferase subunit GatB [bacterium]